MTGRHRRRSSAGAHLGTVATVLAVVAGPAAAAVQAGSGQAPQVGPVVVAAAPPGAVPDPPATAAGTPTPTAAATATPDPAPGCADFTDRADLDAAVEEEPGLLGRLDSDGDGVPCERRFPVERERPAEVEDEPVIMSASACPTSGFDGVKPWVAQAGYHLAARFGIAPGVIGGVAGRARTSFHPGGRALDFPVDRATGDALAGYALDNADELGVIEVIWRQRINFGTGWEAMADRGSDTANHLDHVHLSFTGEPPGSPAPNC